MKYLTILLTLVFFSLLNCKKEDTQACETCTMIIANAEAYPYKVTFQNFTATPFILQPGDTKSFEIPTGKQVTVKGDFQSPYAHNDFSMSYQCPGNCGPVSVILKE